MIAARIIEEIKGVIESGLKDVPDDQILEILPKINTAINMQCVDKLIELTKMDE